jgi:peptide/nickel transport system substrate-binding protein
MNKVAELGDDYGVVEVDGTGPYRLQEWMADDRMVLARNEDYTWGPDFYENTGPVYPEELILQVVPEDASRTALIETGEADINIEVAPRDVSRLQDTAGVTVESFPRVSSNHIGFNLEREMFQDINVRRAVMHGINRQEITEFVMHGQADPAEGYLHPAMVGAADRDQTRPLVEYDPERSQELLEESGWELNGDGIYEKDGEPLSFTLYLTTELNEQIAQAAQAQLREVGIDMQVNRMEGAAFSAATTDGEHDARFIPMIYSSEDHMYFFVSDFIPSPNTIRWQDPEYDELFELSQSTTDEDERINAFTQMEMRMLEEAVVVPIQHLRWIFAWGDHVHGTKFHPIQGVYKMMDFWVE